MNKNVVRGLFAMAGLAVSASAALAQAPSSAQVWEVRFTVDSTGAFAAGPSATAVGITMEARVSILPNTAASGTNNFGISRIGGSNGVFRVTFTDALSNGQGLNQGSVQQGATGQAFTDTNGNPLAGHFSPFRGSFNPQSGPLFLGANSDPNNGVVNNPATGSPFLTQLVGSRALNFGSDGTQAYGNGPDFVPVYRMIYFPRPDFTGNAVREVSVAVTGMSARYIHTVSGTFGSAAPAVNLAPQNFSFQIPTPGAASLLALGGLAIGRRRRA
ncbi:MAG: hypothetical protein JNK35_14080 [Phycisphaerae bacterium]|nr:hypothetical protein [Phycisphaerae bacterium]